MPTSDLTERFKKLDIEVELGFTVEQMATEVERCLNCDIQTVFSDQLCIECDACIDICPVDCLTIVANGTEEELRSAPERTGGESGAAAVRVRGPASDTAASWSRTKICACIAACARSAVRPEPGICRNPKSCCPRRKTTAPANRGSTRRFPDPFQTCPYEQDQRAGTIKIATVNGTGSASANGLLLKSFFRMGIPVVGKNYFPSNIQGLPTWYEIRVTGRGTSGEGRSRRHHGCDERADLCPATWRS